MRREAILFRAHAVSEGARRCLARLMAEAGPEREVWVVGFCRNADALDGFGHARTLVYDEALLSALPYEARLATARWDRTTGHNDLPVLQFFREHPDYARYWVVEYDVRYTGSWRHLLDDLAARPADLLGTTVQRRAENPLWANWPSVSTGGETVAEEHWIKSFIPFGGVTPALLAAVDARYRRGWTGHCEALWPMIASLEGLSIEDIGGRGSFVPPGREGRHYWNTPMDPHLRPGSFVFRPTVAPGQDDQAWAGEDEAARRWAAGHLRTAFRLVHPVKD